MNTITTADTAPVVEHPITSQPGRSIAVVYQGADFAVVNINLPGMPEGGADLNAQELGTLIADLQHAAQVLEVETPVPYLLAV